MSEIKVGSEWVHADGNKYRVTAIGEYIVLLYNDDSSCEFAIHNAVLLNCYKPAPVRRTVWLNVYAWGVSKYENKVTADNNKYEDILWQQEVELIDPREET